MSSKELKDKLKKKKKKELYIVGAINYKAFL